jgi:DNA-binding response OmpR family regulator
MRVLIVEDELRVAEAIKRSLEANNFAVDIVGDADGGLAAARDPDYDLVILDRMLPGSFDGLQLCQTLREEGVHTPVLMLTALGEVDDRVGGLKSGADDYLIKPFSMKELIVRVQVLLRRPTETKGPVIAIEDLRIDTESFEVTRSDEPIKLTSREYKLLSYLMYNKGQTVTKDKIISHVWDGEADILPNTVEVYISALRRKVDRAFPKKAPLIHTIHGFGYRVGKG